MGLIAIYDEQRQVLPVHDVSFHVSITSTSWITYIQRVVLAAKFHGIGKSILHNQPAKAQGKASDAIGWLQKAFGIVDQEEANSGALELKVCIWPVVHETPFKDPASTDIDTKNPW